MGRYIKKEYTGQSMFSDVYKAMDTMNDGRVVALKVTIPDEMRPPHDSLKEASILQNLKELREKANLSDSYIVELLDSWIEDDGLDEQLTIVLPFLPHDLNSVLAQHRMPENGRLIENDDSSSEVSTKWINTLPEFKSKSILWQLASALKFLHAQGIIHRDIKPQNILFETLDYKSPLRLVDFDISWVPTDNYGKEPADEKITDVGSGTYRSPELLFGIDNYGTELDMWAFGCIVCQMFSDNNKYPPFYNENSKVSDIALISTIFGTLGVPTVKTWPEVEHVSSFTHMNFTQDRPPKTFGELARLAPKVVQDELLPKMLCFSSASRITAEEMLNSTYF